MYFRVFILFLFLISSVYSNEQLDFLKESRDIMSSMSIGTNRLDDYIHLIEYNISANKSYSDSLNYANQIINNAYLANDELEYLKLRLDSLDDLVTVDIFLLYDRAILEFKNERFELVLELLKDIDERLYQIEKENTRLNVVVKSVYDVIFNTIFIFFKYLLIIFILVCILYIIFKKQINLYILRKRLNFENNKILVITNLQKKLQNDYFVLSKVSEITYETRSEKYRQLLFELNRKKAYLENEINLRR